MFSTALNLRRDNGEGTMKRKDPVEVQKLTDELAPYRPEGQRIGVNSLAQKNPPVFELIEPRDSRPMGAAATFRTYLNYF